MRKVLAGDAVASGLVVPVRGARVGIEAVRVARVSVQLVLRVLLKREVAAVLDVSACLRRCRLSPRAFKGTGHLTRRSSEVEGVCEERWSDVVTRRNQSR
jgi:hypothetical protein